MANRPRGEVVGVMLGFTGLALGDPLVRSWWPYVLIVAGVAATATYAIVMAIYYLPRVPARPLATGTAVVNFAAGIAAVLVAGPRSNTIQDMIMVFIGYALMRLVGATVDLLTPSVNISLLASFVGAAVGMTAIVLMLIVRPHLSVWAVLAIAAGIGYVEGVITGIALRPRGEPTY